MKKMVKGEVTVFLSMIFLLLIALVGAVLESVSIQVLKNEKRAAAGRALESVFAEYHVKLLEKYDIFALEGTYETGKWSEQNILNRLSFYGAENIKADINKIQYLSDNGGQAFYEQAAEYEKEKYGVDVLESMTGKLSSWKEQMESSEQYEKENTKTSVELDGLLNEAGEELSEENNPIESVSNIRTGKILDVVLPPDFDLSQNKVNLSQMPGKRKLNKGRGTFEEYGSKTLSPIFFNLYLLDKFQCAADTKERALNYELEYLLAGKESDAQNLEEVVKKILKLRFGPNYVYLLSDNTKTAEAEALAAVLCTTLVIPEITEIVKHAILLAWAYGEGIMDVRSLLAGKNVTLMKTRETWQLSLESLLTLGTSGDIGQGSDMEGGYSYKRYLQMLLLLEKKEVLSMRGLDLIECNIQKTEEMPFFKVDNCVTKLGLNNICPMRRGVRYQFKTQFVYQ